MRDLGDQWIAEYLSARERAVGFEDDPLFRAVVEELRWEVQGVEMNLVDCRSLRCRFEELCEPGRREVAYADRSRRVLLVERLEFMPAPQDSSGQRPVNQIE